MCVGLGLGFSVSQIKKYWRKKKFKLKPVFWFLLDFFISFSSSFNKTEINLKRTLVLSNVTERLSLKCQH